MLRDAGVSALLLISDNPELMLDPEFPSDSRADSADIYRAGSADMREAIIRLTATEPTKTLIFCKPVLLEEDILSELIVFLDSRSRAEITASGAYTGIYGVSGDDAQDSALIEALICGGELADMYAIDSEEVGCIWRNPSLSLRYLPRGTASARTRSITT